MKSQEQVVLARATSLQTSQATATLSLGLQQGSFKSWAGGCARILSQCDGWGDDPTGAGGYRTQHTAMRLQRLGSLFLPFSNK